MNGFLRLCIFNILLVGAVCELHELSLLPGNCASISFLVPGGTQVNVTVDVAEYPSQCALLASLNMTQLWRKGRCAEYKWWDTLCKDDISDAHQLCSQWDKLGHRLSPASTAAEPKVQQMTYWECGDNEYYIAFRSSCMSPAKLNINVDIGPLTIREARFCNIVGDYGKDLYERTTIGRLVSIALGSLIIYCLVCLVICFQAPQCTWKKEKKKERAS